MSEKAVISTADNALDSLGRLAAELESDPQAEAKALKGVLAWGWHAVALLAYMRLQPQRDEVDAWLWEFLDEGSPQLEVSRDAHWEERQRLSLLELLDVFSQVDLPLLKPEFYQGWQDRTERCRTLRHQIAGITGSAIGAEQRQGLLVLLAAYHRLLRFPAPVQVEPAPLLAALPHLLDFLEALVDTEGPRGRELRAAVERCRQPGSETA